MQFGPGPVGGVKCGLLTGEPLAYGDVSDSSCAIDSKDTSRSSRWTQDYAYSRTLLNGEVRALSDDWDPGHAVEFASRSPR